MANRVENEERRGSMTVRAQFSVPLSDMKTIRSNNAKSSVTGGPSKFQRRGTFAFGSPKSNVKLLKSSATLARLPDFSSSRLKFDEEDDVDDSAGSDGDEIKINVENNADVEGENTRLVVDDAAANDTRGSSQRVSVFRFRPELVSESSEDDSDAEDGAVEEKNPKNHQNRDRNQFFCLNFV